MPHAGANGVNLLYEITGKGEPLVLVHGSWGDPHDWAAVAPGLAGSFRVVAIDRGDHSQSEWPANQRSRREDEDDLAGLIEYLGLVPAHVAGSWFGASIALGLASRRPELFRSVIAHEPPLMSLVAGDPELQTIWLDETGDALWADIDLDGLAAFTAPALLSDGDQSLPWFPKIMSRLAETMPHAERTTFRGAGHIPQLTHPEAYVAVVTGFLAKSSRAS